MPIRFVRYINNYRAWLVTIPCTNLGVAVGYNAQNHVLSVLTIPWLLLVRHVVVYAEVGSY